MTPERKDDPDKETRGAEEAAAEASGDAPEAAAGEKKAAGKRRSTKAKADAKAGQKADAKAEKKADAKAEEKPKRSRAKKKDEAESKAEEAGEAKDAEAADEAEGQEPNEEAKPKRRRTSAEAAAAAEPKRAAKRKSDGPVFVRARARYVRTAPRKARLVIDHIRGKSVEDARAILQHTPRAASQDVLKLLNSAVANAESNHELVAGELKIHEAYVDEGPTLKRYRPRAMGRATRIRKRTSHMTITLTTKDES